MRDSLRTHILQPSGPWRVTFSDCRALVCSPFAFWCLRKGLLPHRHAHHAIGPRPACSVMCLLCEFTRQHSVLLSSSSQAPMPPVPCAACGWRTAAACMLLSHRLAPPFQCMHGSMHITRWAAGVLAPCTVLHAPCFACSCPCVCARCQWLVVHSHARHTPGQQGCRRVSATASCTQVVLVLFLLYMSILTMNKRGVCTVPCFFCFAWAPKSGLLRPV